jgi:hypothetical protein
MCRKNCSRLCLAPCAVHHCIAAAAVLSVSLRNARKLVFVYGGRAGVVATLIFLYVSATTLILARRSMPSFGGPIVEAEPVANRGS